MTTSSKMDATPMTSPFLCCVFPELHTQYFALHYAHTLNNKNGKKKKISKP